MTPAEKVAALYDADSPRTFREDVEAHLLNGYIIAEPQMMVMARPVDTSASQDLIRNPWFVFPPQRCNAWYIYAFARADSATLSEAVKKLLTISPVAYKCAVWHRKRDGGLRVCPLSRFLGDDITH